MRWKAIVPALALVLGMGSAAPISQASATAQPSPVRLEMSSFINPAYLGSSMSIVYRAWNDHTAPLLMLVSVNIPAGLTILGSFPTCPTLPNNCNLGFVQPGSLANLSVRVRVDAVIDATARGSLTAQSRCVPGLQILAAQCLPVFTATGSLRVRTFASPIGLTIAVAPQPGFVGGDPITATYTIRNFDDSPLIDVVLTPGLPAGWVSTSGCAPPPQACAVGTIPIFGSATRTYTLALSPGTAGTTPINATATATFDSCNDGCMRSATATSVSQVLIAQQPVLTVTPILGPPGFVPAATGTGFPDGATVKLTWVEPVTGRPLLTENLTLTVASGGFTTQVLVFRRDQQGERNLVAEWVSGPRFAPVTASFLVVPDTWVPPLPIRG